MDVFFPALYYEYYILNNGQCDADRTICKTDLLKVFCLVVRSSCISFRQGLGTMLVIFVVVMYTCMSAIINIGKQ